MRVYLTLDAVEYMNWLEKQIKPLRKLEIADLAVLKYFHVRGTTDTLDTWPDSWGGSITVTRLFAVGFLKLDPVVDCVASS